MHAGTNKLTEANLSETLNSSSNHLTEIFRINVIMKKYLKSRIFTKENPPVCKHLHSLSHQGVHAKSF